MRVGRGCPGGQSGLGQWLCLAESPGLEQGAQDGWRAERAVKPQGPMSAVLLPNALALGTPPGSPGPCFLICELRGVAVPPASGLVTATHVGPYRAPGRKRRSKCLLASWA